MLKAVAAHDHTVFDRANTAGCLPCSYIRLFPVPEPTWADWRADEKRRRARRCCRFHRSQTTRCRCQRTVASRIKASPLRPGFPSAPLQEVPAPSPSRILEKIEGGAGKRRKRGAWLRERNSFAIPPFFLPTSSYSPILTVWRGNKSSLRRWIRPSRSTVPLALEGEKFRSAARCHHRANFLWPVPRASSVTSSKLPFLSASPIQNPSGSHTYNP